jgi:malonate transporter and related proteins
MSSVMTIVIPVFALIALGFAAGYWRYFPADAVKALNDYTFTLAVPAFLFRTMAKLEMAQPPIALWLVFFGAAAFTWMVATIATRTVLGRPSIDAPSIAMSSCFGNVVMLGIPMSIAAFGDAAAAPAAMIVSLHTPTLFFVGALHQTVAADARQASLPGMARDLVLELVRNPIIMAILAGTIWRVTGFGLHPAIDRTLLILGQSSVATALVGLGLSLTNFQIKGQAPTLSLILTLKLLVMPATAWLLSSTVFQLSPVATAVVILFAAMPTGANAYLFATKSNRAANSASGAVALGTVLAAFTAAVIVSNFK